MTTVKRRGHGGDGVAALADGGPGMVATVAAAAAALHEGGLGEAAAGANQRVQRHRVAAAARGPGAAVQAAARAR